MSKVIIDKDRLGVCYSCGGNLTSDHICPDKKFDQVIIDSLKMYILVRDSIPLGLAVNTVGHASLACYLKFQDHPDTKVWLATPGFKKITCVVNDGQFEAAKKQAEDYVVMTERSLNGEETAIAFRPRKEYPKHFKFYRLFGSLQEKKIEKLEKEKHELHEQIKHMMATYCDSEGI